jgi:hypothetical protein
MHVMPMNLMPTKRARGGRVAANRHLRLPLVAVMLATTSMPLAAEQPPADTQAPPAEAAANLADFARWVIAADFSADGGTLLTAGGESLLYRPGDVVLWKPADGSRIGELTGHGTAVWAGKISSDGRLAATAGYDGLVKLWNLPERKLEADLEKHTGWVRSLAFSPDGSLLATAGEDGSVVLWNTADGKEARTITAHAGPATCVAFSPDGKTLATGGGDKLVKLFNPADGKQQAKLEGHGDAVWAVAYSADGATLATAAADRTVRLWNTADATPLATLGGHKDWVTSLAFTPDGTRLASGCLDGSVKFWDVKAKGEQEGIEPSPSSVWSVAIAPDGKTIFVGHHAGGRIVPLPAPKLLPPPPEPEKPTPPPADSEPAVVAIKPASFESAAGAQGTIGDDAVVAVSGTLAKDTYTLTAVVPEGGDVVALRIDCLAHESLPAKGPGRAKNGNFVLSRLGLAHGPPGSAETPTAVSFAAAEADYAQPNYQPAGAIDDNPETGWGVHNGTGKSHHAIFRLPAEGTIPAGAPLKIILDQQYKDGTHALGRFKISVVQEAKPAAEAEKPTKE